MAELIVELIALVVIGYVLWRYAKRPVQAMMRKQQEAIAKQVEEAHRASERRAEADRKYKEAVAEARTEAAKIRDTARADAQRIVEEIREFAQREVERIRQRGRDDLESQRLQMVRELRARIGQLTVAQATELVTAHLSDDGRRTTTVDRFLDGLEAMAAPAAAPKPRRTRKPKATTTASKGEG